jgi:hypothetical protein
LKYPVKQAVHAPVAMLHAEQCRHTAEVLCTPTAIESRASFKLASLSSCAPHACKQTRRDARCPDQACRHAHPIPLHFRQANAGNTLPPPYSNKHIQTTSPPYSFSPQPPPPPRYPSLPKPSPSLPAPTSLRSVDDRPVTLATRPIKYGPPEGLPGRQVRFTVTWLASSTMLLARA